MDDHHFTDGSRSECEASCPACNPVKSDYYLVNGVRFDPRPELGIMVHMGTEEGLIPADSILGLANWLGRVWRHARRPSGGACSRSHADVCVVCGLPVSYITTTRSGLWYHTQGSLTHEPRPSKFESRSG